MLGRRIAVRPVPAGGAREAWLLELQRTAGNAAVAALLQVQRDYGPEVGKAPADWETKVRAARSGADRLALVKAAVQPAVAVVDKTADCSSDAAVNPDHLVEYSSGSPTVSYDDGLNNKRGRADDAGFTKGHHGKDYVMLGPMALKDDDYFWTRIVLSHEFDHVRQTSSRSGLRGSDSEVDAWTSSFIRDFHRAYDIGQTGAVCYVKSYRPFAQLPGYYEKADVSDAVRANSVRRIKAYYDTTIKTHSVHDRVFKFWLYKTLKGSHPRLAQELNSQLGLNVDPSASPASMRQFPCADASTASFPSPPTVNLP